VRCRHGSGNYVEPEVGWLPLPEPGRVLLLVCPWAGPDATPPAGHMIDLDAGIARAAASLVARTVARHPSAWPAGCQGLEPAGAILVDPPGAGLVAGALALTAGPVVIVEHALAVRELPVIEVLTGCFYGMYEAAAALLRLGHRRIAFLDREDWQTANRVKFDGYSAALEEAGAGRGRELVRLVDPYAPRVEPAMEELAALGAAPTAVICHSDATAAAVLEWMRGRNLVPGRDLSVIGSGDLLFRRGGRRDLSSVRAHYRRIGEVAAMQALCARRPEAMRALVVPDNLKLRGSVGPPRGA
jgi:DNA-binding LacI/PurR family transcriptional regulator